MFYIKGVRAFYAQDASKHSSGAELYFSIFSEEYLGLINFEQDMSATKGADATRLSAMNAAKKSKKAKGNIKRFGYTPDDPSTYDGGMLVPGGVASAQIKIGKASKSGVFIVKMHIIGGNPPIFFDVPFNGTPPDFLVGDPAIDGTVTILSTDSADVQSGLVELHKMD